MSRMLNKEQLFPAPVRLGPADRNKMAVGDRYSLSFLPYSSKRTCPVNSLI